jgi:hypothetical protein
MLVLISSGTHDWLWPVRQTLRVLYAKTTCLAPWVCLAGAESERTLQLSQLPSQNT